jgi:hypothetical protein
MHEGLSRLINGEFASKGARLALEFTPRTIFKRQAAAFVERFQPVFSNEALGHDKAPTTLDLPQLDEPSPPLVKLKNTIIGLNSDLIAFIIQGSLGSNEQVSYSDCDALVIVKDETLQNPKRLSRVAYHLFKARKYTYDIDPLQHHGWFVASESMMQAWPQHYLPVEALTHASRLDGNESAPLTFSPASNPKMSQKHLLGMMANIEANLDTGIAFKNLYRFKGFISKILLIPALYCHAKYGNGIFKRESFDAAQNDFSADEWRIIELCSSLRLEWPEVSAMSPKLLSRRPGLIGDIVRRKRSTSVPATLRDLFTESETNSIRNLHTRIKSNFIEGSKHD